MNPSAYSQITRSALAGILALGVSIQATLAQEIVTSPTARAAVQARTYWTAARKANAQPMPMPSVDGTPAPVPLDALRERGPAGSVNGNAPGEAPGTPLSVTEPQVEVAPAFGIGSTVWYNYPPPASLYVPVLDYIFEPIYPHTAVGKLFFSSGTTNFACSASSVTSAGTWGGGNRQTVITAGHCCSNGAGTFYQNWLFEPAHLNGAAPLGSWTAFNATVLNTWHFNGDMSRDVCVLQMRTLNGQNVNDAVGALGYAFNQPLPQHYHATGWPAEPPFDGGLLFISAASDAETDTAQAGSFAFTHGIGNWMTGGSSGGAWILGYQTFTGANQFNGLNSYKYVLPDRPAEMFGPYIDDVIINVLFQAAATAPAAP